MTYYIFGGDGFVGKYLAKALVDKNEKVIICDINQSEKDEVYRQVEFLYVDITIVEQIQLLPITKKDAIINLAANQYHTKVPRNRKEYFFSVNAQGTENILKVYFEKGCRKMLMFTTDMIYGRPQYLPVDITHPQKPFGPYGESKKKAEQICFRYRKKGMNITIMRPRMIMGPGRMGVLVKLFKLIDANLPIPTIGNGKNHYQMISVFDCVSAILRAIDKKFPNKEYNLGSKNPPTTKVLLKEVISYANSASWVISTPGRLIKFILYIFDIVGFTIMYKEQFMIADEEYLLDISETENDLDWIPVYNDSDMIKSSYEMYENNC
jgi:nucleoside-diphosphate-sugar epimerase